MHIALHGLINSYEQAHTRLEGTNVGGPSPPIALVTARALPLPLENASNLLQMSESNQFFGRTRAS